MSVSLLIIAGLCFFSSNAPGQRKPLPKFQDYPVADSEYYKGPHKKIIKNRFVNFWTYIHASSKPDFCGHYIIGGAGIGTGEIEFAIIDARTGKVCCNGFSISGNGKSLENPLRYRLSSKLLIVHGDRNEDGKLGTYYYKFEHDSLSLIRKTRY